MTVKLQCMGLYTLVRRELIRMFRIATQVFLPPVITTLLYFLIFGAIMGQRIGTIDGANYTLFIAPGLIMMSVITNAYVNVSTSLFSVRFQKSIEELLISPMHDGLILLGYTLGGVLRAILVALLVFGVSDLFLDITVHSWPATLTIVVLVASVFSLAGFANGMLARSFDDVAIVPTFVLTPLTYLGGVFYATSMLPPVWQTISQFNPVLYMVNALRHAMIGQPLMNAWLTISIILGLLMGLTALNLVFLKKGVGLRE